MPGKNIMKFNGKPLIEWTIEQALSCSLLDRVVVSTEDENIADIARAAGADVPFMRSQALASDTTSGVEVVLDTISRLERSNSPYDIVVLLQPTSPNRISEDIYNSIEMLFEKNAKCLVSVCEAEHHPFRMNTLPESKSMKNFMRPETENLNRQEFPVYFRTNGAIFIAHCDYLKKNKSFFGDGTFAYIMPVERSADIDSELDFKLAEYICTQRLKK